MAQKKKYQKKQAKKQETEKQAIKPIAEAVDFGNTNSISMREVLIAVMAVVVIVGASLFLYNKAFDYDIVYCDDNIFLYDYFDNNRDTENLLDNFNKTIGTTFYRPILQLSLIWDTNRSDNAECTKQTISPKVFHRTNVFLHILGSVLLFVFIWRLGYPVEIASLLGLLMAVHPILTPAASWISGRNDSLLTVILLLAFILLTLYFDKKGPLQWVAYVFHLFFFAVALFTKEISAFIPFVGFAYIFLFRKKNKLLDKKNSAIIVGWFITGLIWFVQRYNVVSEMNSPDTIGAEALTKSYPTFFALFGKIFAPVEMIALSSFEWFSIAVGVVLFIGLLVLMFTNKNVDRKRAGFGLLWYVILIVPTLLVWIVFVDDFFDYAEHRAYSLMAGVFILVLEILRGFKVNLRGPVTIVVFAVIIGLFGYKAYSYKDTFHDRFSFWSHMVEMYPHKSRGYFDLGKSYLVNNKLDSAEALYMKGIERNPDNKNLYIDLSALYQKRNDFVKAEEYARKALAIKSNDHLALYNLAKSLAASKNPQKYPEAEKLFQYFAQKMPNRQPMAQYELGLLYANMKKYPESIEAFNTFLQRYPNHYPTLLKLGACYASSGQFPMSEKVWAQAVAVEPKRKEAVLNLIRVSLFQYQTPGKIQEMDKWIAKLRELGQEVPQDIANEIRKIR